MRKALLGIGFVVILVPRASAAETSRGPMPQEAGKAAVRTRLDKIVPLDFHDAPVEDVLRFVHSATAEPGQDGIRFAIERVGPRKVHSLGGRRVTIHADDQSLEAVLARMLEPLDLRYEVARDLVWISSKSANPPPGDGSKGREDRTRAKLDQAIPLHFDGVPIEDVLGFIRSATAEPGYEGMRFATELVGPGKVASFRGHRVTIHSDDESIRRDLIRLLKPLDLHFEVVGGLILITDTRGAQRKEPKATR